MKRTEYKDMDCGSISNSEEGLIKTNKAVEIMERPAVNESTQYHGVVCL